MIVNKVNVYLEICVKKNDFYFFIYIFKYMFILFMIMVCLLIFKLLGGVMKLLYW